MQRMYDCHQNNMRLYRDNYYRQPEKRISISKCCIQPEGAFPECTPVAMAYIPFQNATEIYDECKAFERGTAFPCLDKPFYGGACRC